ncbi:uncharacterized protein [Drosophila tropicalis]|uniref:uncharacterized protein n=1 Tax=Drosophila tropicalis TaxID=46794 RepID=UPI0035AB9971
MSEIGTRQREKRKPTIWTREKIYKLIELYRSSDCLWNHYSELYKNKDCRSRAIEHICRSLGITKLTYAKKVHNLRNQFNSELKKLERRLEESGSGPTQEKTCRWEHFETLKFLRTVIEPRPGFQAGQTQCKKLINKMECTYTEATGDNETTGSVAKSEFDSIEQLICADDINTHSLEPPKASPVLTNNSAPASMPTSTSLTDTNLVQKTNEILSLSKPIQAVAAGRDQWDAFGELIANEFRNLNSPLSRKKLKRRIMQIILEVGEEDDQLYPVANA